MTSGPTDPIYDPVLEKMLTKPSHDKARAYGYSLANSVLRTFQAGDFTVSKAIDNCPFDRNRVGYRKFHAFIRHFAWRH